MAYINAMSDAPDTLTKTEVARILRCSGQTVTRKVADGILPRPLPGIGRPRWLKTDIDRYVAIKTSEDARTISRNLCADMGDITADTADRIEIASSLAAAVLNLATSCIEHGGFTRDEAITLMRAAERLSRAEALLSAAPDSFMAQIGECITKLSQTLFVILVDEPVQSREN